MLIDWIKQTETKLQQTNSGLKKLVLGAWLLVLHVGLGIDNVLVVLFLPSNRSFPHLYNLDNSRGYTVSYAAHCRLQHSFRFSTVAYSLVLATTILFVYVAFDIINPEKYGQAARAATLTVNTNINDDNGECRPSPEECSLHDAINNAEAGDTIRFSSGFTIELTSSDQLQGLEDDGLTVDGLADDGNRVTIDCNNIQQNGFAIIGDQITIKNINISDCVDFGIQVQENADDFVVDNVQATSNLIGLNIRVGSGGTVTNSVFQDNIGDGGNGIFANTRSGLLIDNNDIIHNGDASSPGIKCNDCTDTTISNNYVTESGAMGVLVDGGSDNTIKSNTIGMDRNGAVAGNGGSGVVVQSTASATVSHNTILNNSQVGVHCNSCTETTIASNTIYGNNGQGILLESASGAALNSNIIGADNSGQTSGNILDGIKLSSSSNNQISGNTIVANGGVGITLAGSSTNTISGNNIGYGSNIVGNFAPNLGGISVIEGSSNNVIGANLAGDGSGNIIHSEISSIEYSGSTTTGNVHRKNSYYRPATSIITLVNEASSVTPPNLTRWFEDAIFGDALADSVIDIYGDGGDQSAAQYLGSTTADAEGKWLFEDETLSANTQIWGLASIAGSNSSPHNTIVTQTPVTISNVTTAPTLTKATISWQTNFPTIGNVTYERSDGVGEEITITLDGDPAEQQSVSLSDLEEGITYNCTITAEDPEIEDNTAEADCTFSTTGDSTGPVVSDLTVTAVTDTSATITWTTNEPAKATIEYGTTEQLGESVSTTTFETSHSLSLTGLQPSTIYYYRLTNTDASGNSTVELISTFTTAAKLTYADEVASTIAITDEQDRVTEVAGNDGDDIDLQYGDLTFTFTDTFKRFTDEQLHFVLALVKKKQQAIVDRKQAFDAKGKVAIEVKKDLLEMEKQYVVSTGIINKAGDYLNPTGLAERFTFTLQDIPQLISPAQAVSYRMPKKFVVASKAQYVIVSLLNSADAELFHCRADITDGLGQCQPPFGVALGAYTLKLVDARGGTWTQDFIISDVAANNTLTTDDRSSHFYDRIIYGQPTFTGLTTPGHSVELYIPQVDGAMQATVTSGSGTAAVAWNFTLKLVNLPVGVTKVRIIDRQPDGSVVKDYNYLIFRTYRPVAPAVVDPANNKTFKVAPVIRVLGPNDHVVQLLNSAGQQLSEAQFQNGERRFALAEWFTKPGTYTVTLKNTNSLGLPSATATFTFTIAARRSGTITPTPTPTETKPTEEITPTETVTEEKPEEKPTEVKPVTIADTSINSETNRAALTFNTSVPARCTLFYGTAVGATDQSIAEAVTTATQNHTFTVTSLNQNTTYHYQISCSAEGKTSTSADATFETKTAITTDTNDNGLSDVFETVVSENGRLDSDHDGISDLLEQQYGLDPAVTDSDGDGLSDGLELTIGTDPAQADTDGDGVIDSESVAYLTDPQYADSDGDQLSDGEENRLGCNPAVADSDGDGVNDSTETLVGTSCTSVDTDNDGIADSTDDTLDSAEALPNLSEVEQATQNSATNAYTQTGETQPTDYPFITTEVVRLTSTQKEQLQRTLSDKVTTTTLNITPDATTTVTPDAIPVVQRETTIDIGKWFRRQPNDASDTSTKAEAMIELSGEIDLPQSAMIPYHLHTQPMYVEVTMFSTPTVKIAQLDTDGHWTMSIPAELLGAGEHVVYAAAEINGTRGDQIEVTKIVIQEKKTLSNTTWLVLINLAIAALAVMIGLILQLKHKQRQATETPNNL